MGSLGRLFEAGLSEMSGDCSGAWDALYTQFMGGPRSYMGCSEAYVASPSRHPESHGNLMGDHFLFELGRQ